MGARFGTINVQGTVRKGYFAQWPEVRLAKQELPGIDGVGQVEQGLRDRPIVVPICVFGYQTRAAIKALEAQLLDLYRRQTEFTLVVEVTGGSDTFSGCVFRSLQPRSDIVEDVAGTLGGGYFVEWELVVAQLVP